MELALVTVKVIEANVPVFEERDRYSFSVKEGEQGLSVGFVKVLDLLHSSFLDMWLYQASYSMLGVTPETGINTTANTRHLNS